MADRVGIPSDRLRRGDIDPRQMAALLECKQHLAGLPLRIDETGALSLAQVASRVRRARRQGVGLVIIDYLQLMAGNSRENRTQDVTQITSGLKAMAKEIGVPVLLLSQLNRAAEGRTNKRPQLADLRDSGSIEQDADVVMFVYREDYYIEREAPAIEDPAYQSFQDKLAQATGKAEIIVAKNRHGSTGVVPVSFNRELTKFSGLARDGGPT